MEVMKVGVVKARHDKGVAVIDDFSSVAAQSFGHGFEGPGPENAVAPDGPGAGSSEAPVNKAVVTRIRSAGQ